jgi:hypothetical protein
MKTLLALCILAACSVSARSQSFVEASKRTEHCTSHPNDAFNCTAIPTVGNDGTHSALGLARLCPGQPKDVEAKKRNVASWFALDGVDDEGFEKMGLCKLSDDETTALLQHQFTRQTTRAYYDTDKRQPKKIYVALETGGKLTPEIVMSDFRNALRSIPDVELTNDAHPDFLISVSALQAKNNSGNPIGYAIAMRLIKVYEKPDDHGKEYLPVLVFDNISTVGPASVNEDIQDSVAHLNNENFERFRSEWPYKTK